MRRDGCEQGVVFAAGARHPRGVHQHGLRVLLALETQYWNALKAKDWATARKMMGMDGIWVDPLNVFLGRRLCQSGRERKRRGHHRSASVGAEADGGCGRVRLRHQDRR